MPAIGDFCLELEVFHHALFAEPGDELGAAFGPDVELGDKVCALLQGLLGPSETENVGHSRVAYQGLALGCGREDADRGIFKQFPEPALTLARRFLGVQPFQFRGRTHGHQCQHGFGQMGVCQRRASDDRDQADRLTRVTHERHADITLRPQILENLIVREDMRTLAGKQQTALPTTSAQGVSFRA